MEEGSELGRSLIKQLACCNKTNRNKTLRVLLKTWLPSQTQLPEEHMKMLWKGLFYCVWHADKVPVQSELFDRLSSLLLVLDLGLSVQYFSGFLLTMRREWAGIDAHRLDKFYLLIRRFINKCFALLKKNSWDMELTQKLVAVLDERTFSAEDKFRANGVNYHIASVFLEELKSFLPLRLEVLEVLFKPFVSVMGKLPDKVLLGKIKSNMFDVLLRMGKRLLEVKKAGDDVDSREDVMLLGTIALVMGFSSKFFGLGSSPECCQGNRKMLFGLHEEFMKLEKDVESSGYEFSIPDVANENEEEVPTLVSIDSKMEVDALKNDLRLAKAVANGSNGTGSKRFKKCKDKKASVVPSNKTKRKKKDISDLTGEKRSSENENENISIENSKNSSEEQNNDDRATTLNDFVISNLQKQFEIIAAEAGLGDGVASACDNPEAMLTEIVSKKRKRTESLRGCQFDNSDLNGEDAEDVTIAKSGKKSTKKVTFSMKDNLVWKPQTPLPPQSLRLPPSVTPRGSALKKGVPPGPIREMPPPSAKKPKLKKMRKGVKSVSPSVKRLKKLKSHSA